MTKHEFHCALGAVASLILAALASGFGYYIALFFCLCAAALSLFMWRKSKRDRGK